MLARAAVLVGSILLLALVWWGLRDGTAPPAAVSPGAQGAVVEPPTRAGGTGTGAELAPTRAESAATRTSIELRARVGVQLRPDAGLALELEDWPVEVGTRGGDGTFEVRTARVDAAGRSELEYAETCEVEWVRCTPPADSGCAVALEWTHWELSPEEPLAVELALRRAGAWIEGEVVTRDGRGVADVRVHAFDDGGPRALERWRPSPVVATTDAWGRFRFPRLAEGDWTLAVDPGEWLQLHPVLGDWSRGRNAFELREGRRADSAQLLVERGATLPLRVVDVAGRAVEGAHVVLEPRFLLGGRMRAYPANEVVGFPTLTYEPDPESPTFPYGNLAWSTDARGEARLAGVPGTWRLEVRGPAASPRHRPALSFEVELPGAATTLTLPGTFASARGRLVDERGAALPGRAVRVALRGDDERLSTVYADAAGRFEVGWLQPDRTYDLVFENLVFVDMRVPLQVGGAEQMVVLRDGLRPDVRAVDAAGEPLADVAFRLLAARPTPVRPDESLELEGREAWVSLRTNVLGRVPVPELPRGEYELGLVRTVATGGVDEHGYAALVDPRGVPITHEQVVQRWTLPVTNEPQVLVVAVPPGEAPKAPPLPKHTGQVRDAASAAPLAGATVVLWNEAVTTTERTDGAGRFAVTGVPYEHTLSVRAAGYLPLDVGPRDWPAGWNTHAFELERGGGELDLTMLDAAGAPLPDVELRARDADGRLLVLGWYPLPEQRDLVLWQREATAPKGHVRLLGLPTGPVTLEADVTFASFGTCTLQVESTGGVQRETLRLSRTREDVLETIRGLSGPGDIED